MTVPSCYSWVLSGADSAALKEYVWEVFGELFAVGSFAYDFCSRTGMEPEPKGKIIEM